MRRGCLLAVALVAGIQPRIAAARSSDVDHAAEKARLGVRSIVKRLSGQAFRGRDNNTPESDRAQRLLIRKLGRLGSGLNT
ncbi:MAG TPA: hypothetical protein VLA79_13890, partial [Polyangia bacterium]|nr:hypothetical protein [Polyangia bacterium]